MTLDIFAIVGSRYGRGQCSIASDTQWKSEVVPSSPVCSSLGLVSQWQSLESGPSSCSPNRALALRVADLTARLTDSYFLRCGRGGWEEVGCI